MSTAAYTMLKVSDLARRWQTNSDKVIAFIRRGELRAVNISLSTRPRFRIDMADVLIFEEGRRAQPHVKPSRKGRRSNREVISFF